jgi:hypothetical protein
MAKRRLTLEDIRVTWRGVIFAAPMWSYEGDMMGGWTRIGKLWKPVYEELARREAEREAARKEVKEFRQVVKTAIQSLRLSNHEPSLHYPTGFAIKRCRVCSERFFALGNTSTCTEECAAVRRAATRTRGARVPRKPVDHAPQKCQQCGETFTPNRSDARFCSARCRVAKHRQSTRAIGEA